MHPSTSTGVGVSWSSSGTSNDHRIERSLDGGTSWSAVALVSVSTAFSDTELTADAQVCYPVIAYNRYGGWSDMSNLVIP
jgi:hypothetical protein